MAVHDKRRLVDGFELRESLAAGLAPFDDRRPLRRHRLRRCRHVDVFFPHVPSRPERLAGELARPRGTKKKIEESLEWAFPGFRIGQAAVPGVFRVLCWSTPPRTGTTG